VSPHKESFRGTHYSAKIKEAQVAQFKPFVFSRKCAMAKKKLTIGDKGRGFCNWFIMQRKCFV
jgi:hypothetical protein